MMPTLMMMSMNLIGLYRLTDTGLKESALCKTEGRSQGRLFFALKSCRKQC
jgi:hypothetical protein